MDKQSPQRSHRIGVLICAQNSLGSYGTVLDTFRMAQEMKAGHQFELTRISEDGQPVSHPDGLLQVDAGLEALPHMDVVLIPSLWIHGPQAVKEHALLIDALRRLSPKVLVATLCTGAYLLGASGRLDGKRATTHWMLASGFQDRYPQAFVQSDRNLTHDAEVICSGGSLAGVDVCLYVVQLLAGRDMARNLARLMVTDLSRGAQNLYTPPQGWRRHQDEGIHLVEAYLLEHHARTVSLHELATLIHTSSRTLQRRFLAATGQTPLQYQQAMRMDRAKDLLETTKQSVGEVSDQVGYEDRVAFGRQFKKATGLTPAAYRQRMGQWPT